MTLDADASSSILTWKNSTVIKDNVADDVKKLKDETDGDILVAGRGERIQTLLDEGLVDQWRRMIFPVIVHQGKHLRAFAELCGDDPDEE